MYYLIGKSLKHTMSPYIHKCMGVDYAVMELADESKVDEFLQQKNFLGLNVTIPYKEKVFKSMDFVDDVAKKTHAINTIVHKNGKLWGYNTDVFGMQYALQFFNIDIAHKNVLILGSGGTAKSAYYTVQSMGAKTVNFVSRTGQINYQNCYQMPCDVIINTTPVGMYPNNFDSIIDLSKFGTLSGVFDAVYNPLCTKLIMQAKNLGVCCGNGLIMLVAQAVMARNLFLDKNSTLEIMDIYLDLLQKQSNIILIGMPGSGKSAVGQILAKQLNKQFFDTDAVVEKLVGKNIVDIITNTGERYFRQQEEKALDMCVKNSGAVIATGGGAVMSASNRQKIAQSGVVVWLTRDIKDLPLENRPLSTDIQAVKKLHQLRQPIYQELADIVVKNKQNQITNTVATIRSEYEKNIGN